MRGKQLHTACGRAQRRIIPARAGQTGVGGWLISVCTDHPRACGANRPSLQPISVRNGSSPRVRGKRPCPAGGSGNRRIIPARAGQTVECYGLHVVPPDHPRACGANLTVHVDMNSQHGSSPRVRGKPHRFRQPLHLIRIIPARAGQTPMNPAYSITSSDHPRACGANAEFSALLSTADGSSPRVRGKLISHLSFLLNKRIIPARAGQT